MTWNYKLEYHNLLDMLCSFHSFKTCYAEVQIKRGGWGGLYQIPLCYEGLDSFSNIYSRGPALVEAPQAQAFTNLPADGKKTQTESIWFPLPSSACVFHLATGISRRRTAQFPKPALKGTWCHWGSIITSSIWFASGWAGSVPTLVWQSALWE